MIEGTTTLPDGGEVVVTSGAPLENRSALTMRLIEGTSSHKNVTTVLDLTTPLSANETALDLMELEASTHLMSKP